MVKRTKYRSEEKLFDGSGKDKAIVWNKGIG